MKKFTAIAAAVLLAAATFDASAIKKDAYTGSRIFWDFSSRQQLFNAHSNYARIIQLQDGRIMVACEGGGGISVRYSSDYGSTWTESERIATNETNLPFAVPDLIQLSDGTIVVGFNPRPSSPYSEERRFGCRCVISTDNGATWTDPITIYDASYLGSEGCWEPSFLELPSGELQCYFADESDFDSSSEQCISMCRSFDKGRTWSERTRVSFRSGARDGMPVPILTEASEIVVIIEDNGWPSRYLFRATTVRCSLEDNWSEPVLAGSANREMIFANDDDKNYVSAAPYLRQLPTGETIASWQGDHNGRTSCQESTYDMFVAVGDADARNFKAVTAPFDLSGELHSLWNSVACVGDGSVIALGSIGGANAINMIKGYPKQYFEADYGTPTLDGTAIKETWTAKNGQQICMGSAKTNKVYADYLWDDQYIYFSTRVIDSDIIYGQELDNDYVELFLDTENCCDTYGQVGMYQFILNLDGTVEMKAGSNNRWATVSDAEGIVCIPNIKSSYYELEVAIPWSVLGYSSAPINNTIRTDIRVSDFTGDDLIDITITDAVRRQSWSWMELKLNPNPESELQSATDDTATDINVVVADKTIQVTAPTDIANIALYSLSGGLIYSAKVNDTTHKISTSLTGGGVIRITLADGRQISKKVLLN